MHKLQLRRFSYFSWKSTLGLLCDRQIISEKRETKYLTLLTSELSKQWNMKMKNPCNELKIAKRYWNAIVFLSSARIPNSHVTPSNGNKTTVDLIPDLWRTRHQNQHGLNIGQSCCWLVIQRKVSHNHPFSRRSEKFTGCKEPYEYSLDKIKLGWTGNSVCLNLNNLPYYQSEDYRIDLQAEASTIKSPYSLKNSSTLIWLMKEPMEQLKSHINCHVKKWSKLYLDGLNIFDRV